MLRTGLAAMLLLAAAPAFHYERPIQLAADLAAETCVVLPVDLLAHAAPQLADLRLMAGDRETAYEVRISGDTAVGHARPEQILNLGEHDGVVSFDVEMTEPRYSRVLLRLGRSRFSVLVHVSGIQRMGETGVAFPEIAYSSDDTQDSEYQERLITLPESSFRYLHFELQTLALDPVRPQDIAGVDVLAEHAPPPQYVPVAVASASQQKPRTSVYAFAVQANVPVERLSFESDDPQAVFSRAATLTRVRFAAGDSGYDAGAPTETESITLTQSTNRDGPTRSNVDGVDLPTVPHASTVTLTVDNGDDAPLSLRRLQLQMRERQLCFLRRPDTSYMLRYGNASLRAPEYDLTPIQAAAATASISTLGVERLLLPGVAEQVLPFTERHPVLLWVALVLVVATLGMVAFRSAMKGSRTRG